MIEAQNSYSYGGSQCNEENIIDKQRVKVEDCQEQNQQNQHNFIQSQNDSQFQTSYNQSSKIQKKIEEETENEEGKDDTNTQGNEPRGKSRSYYKFSKACQKYLDLNNTTICSICNKEYRDKYTMRLHLFKQHQMLPFKCQGCDQRFQSQRDLKVHIEDFHLKLDRQRQRSSYMTIPKKKNRRPKKTHIRRWKSYDNYYNSLTEEEKRKLKKTKQNECFQETTQTMVIKTEYSEQNTNIYEYIIQKSEDSDEEISQEKFNQIMQNVKNNLTLNPYDFLKSRQQSSVTEHCQTSTLNKLQMDQNMDSNLNSQTQILQRSSSIILNNQTQLQARVNYQATNPPIPPFIKVKAIKLNEKDLYNHQKQVQEQCKKLESENYFTSLIRIQY